MAILLYKDQSIEQRDVDGYVNATQMAKVNNFNINDWSINSQTIAYIECVSQQTGIPAHSLKIKVSEGFPAKTNTWVHPLVAIHLAQWISPEFHVWCNRHIKTLMETGKTEVSITQSKKELARTTAKEDFELLIALGFEDDKNIKQLIRDKLEDELSISNLRSLMPQKPKEYTIAKVRATELGYSIKEIGNGSALGKFVARNVSIAYEQRIGKYSVKHYEVNDSLDTAIKTYFGMKQMIAA
ncbi:MAG: KilA-N domain-containing protein [Waterburya sp.]